MPSPVRLLSVVCLSGCNVGAPYSAACNFRQFFSPYDSPGTLVFWCQKLLVGTPLSPWNLRSKWPTPFQTAQFQPISAHSASTVIASEKSSISTYRKSTTRFPTSHRWTVYVTPKSPIQRSIDRLRATSPSTWDWPLKWRTPSENADFQSYRLRVLLVLALSCFFSPYDTFAIHWHPQKILRRSSQGNPFVGGFKRKGGVIYSDFWHLGCENSETMLDRR